jgi:carbon storage regulator
MAMLVLTRKTGEKVRFGSDVTLVVLAIQGGQVRIGIEAPAQVRILRGELHDRVAKSGAASGDRPGDLVPAGEHHR